MATADRAVHRSKKHTPTPFIYVRAPEVLSVVRNAEEVSTFIGEVKQCLERRQAVWVVLEHVREIDYDAITVMLSAVVRFKVNRVKLNGDFPKDPKAKEILVESGFFDHLQNSRFKNRDSYELLGKNSILTHAMRTVDSELGEKIIEAASMTVWKEKRRCPGVQRTMIELMQNTNNHASLEREGEKHWWLSVQHIKEERRVIFSFVDYGVGVFVNLENKRPGNKFYRALEKLKDTMEHGNNAALLRLIFRGELHRTASRLSFRGKGLPGIHEAVQKKRLSNLVMITNDVFFKSEGNEYRLLKNSFQGTFVYWELCEQDASLQYETQDCN